MLKVSHEELIDDGRAADDSVGTLAGRRPARCRSEGAETVLISRAGEPALALLDDGTALRVHVAAAAARPTTGAPVTR